MESSLLGLILDSSIAIDAERRHLNASAFLRQIAARAGECETGLCSITVAELVHGVYRANTPERRERRRTFLDDLKAALPVYPISDGTAELVGKINAEAAAKGLTIPFDDLLIGTCALERGYAIATRNVRHFERIPGLRIFRL